VVPLTLLAFWLFFLPRHDWWGTALHFFLITAATGFGVYSYRLAVRTLSGGAMATQQENGGNQPFWVRMWRAVRFHLPDGMKAAGTFVASILVLSVGAAIDPGDNLLTMLGYETHADLRGEDLSTKPSGWTGREETADLEIAQVKGVDLVGRDLRNTDAGGTFLVKAQLESADLRSAYLFRANLFEANLIDANLSDANLIDANLSGANLSSANLSPAYLGFADLHGANLSSANLSSADLGYADFRDADLVSADLVNANLINANLINANLSDADLRGAILVDVDLTSAVLVGGQRSMVRLYRQAKQGQIDPSLVGRLAHILNSLVSMDRDVDFAARLDRSSTVGVGGRL